MKYRIFLSIFIAAVLSGCSSTASYVKAKGADSENCLVYVFRDEFVLIYNMSVESGGKKYASLEDFSYTKFNLPVGQQTINGRWALLTSGIPLDVSFNCMANQSHYIAFGGYLTNKSFGSFTRNIQARELNEAEAKERLKSYTYDLDE